MFMKFTCIEGISEKNQKISENNSYCGQCKTVTESYFFCKKDIFIQVYTCLKIASFHSILMKCYGELSSTNTPLKSKQM